MGRVVFLNRREGAEMTSIFEVARFFLTKESMTHLKLQKLCYYAQAWYLTIYGQKLFDEEFQAWLHGPVSPSLYQRYKQWGWHEISEYTGIVNLCTETIYFLEMVYNMYGSFTGNQLENLTHSEDPWIFARNGETGYCTNPISDENIKKYYRDILKQTLKAMEEK